LTNNHGEIICQFLVKKCEERDTIMWEFGLRMLESENLIKKRKSVSDKEADSRGKINRILQQIDN